MSSIYRFFLVSFYLLFLVACSTEPAIRPTQWAQKVQGINIHAFYKVDSHLYRSGLPSQKGMQQIERLGVRSILNLHHFGNDNAEIQGTSLQVKQIRVNVTKMNYAEIVQSLRYIMQSDKPVLVHCLTGADRTGVVVAAYRMLQGWSKQAAMNEMLNGGFHFRRYLFPNLIPLVENINIEQLRRDVQS
jgi:protein tyrosine phosphatase (PTP) superfamily phosphohydrolase (DUF442 family)